MIIYVFSVHFSNVNPSFLQTLQLILNYVYVDELKGMCIKFKQNVHFMMFKTNY